MQQKKIPQKKELQVLVQHMDITRSSAYITQALTILQAPINKNLALRTTYFLVPKTSPSNVPSSIDNLHSCLKVEGEGKISLLLPFLNNHGGIQEWLGKANLFLNLQARIQPSFLWGRLNSGLKVKEEISVPLPFLYSPIGSSEMEREG